MAHGDLYDLDTAAARWVLNLADSDYLKLVATAALDHGVYSPSIAEIATVQCPVLYEVGPWFVRALQELGIATPDRETATWILLTQEIRAVAEGRTPPSAGASKIYSLSRLPTIGSREYLRDSHLLHHFIGLSLAYDDVETPGCSYQGKRGDEACAALDAEVVRHARGWLRATCPDEEDSLWRHPGGRTRPGNTEQLRADAQRVVDCLGCFNCRIPFGYNRSSLVIVGDFIDRQRLREDVTDEQKGTLGELLGAFLGECIIESVGGAWVHHAGKWQIHCPTCEEAVSPFTQVASHFQEGEAQSILTLFDRLEPPSSHH